MSKFILLAEDDEDDQMLFRSVLGTICKPCQLDIAGDGIKALDKLHACERIPDLVVLDVNMPQMNGMQCLKAIRSDARYQNLKVVIFSTSKREDVIDQSYKLGADLFLTKPDSYDGLKEAMRQILAA